MDSLATLIANIIFHGQLSRKSYDSNEPYSIPTPFCSTQKTAQDTPFYESDTNNKMLCALKNPERATAPSHPLAIAWLTFQRDLESELDHAYCLSYFILNVLCHQLCWFCQLGRLPTFWSQINCFQAMAFLREMFPAVVCAVIDHWLLDKYSVISYRLHTTNLLTWQEIIWGREISFDDIAFQRKKWYTQHTFLGDVASVETNGSLRLSHMGHK